MNQILNLIALLLILYLGNIYLFCTIIKLYFNFVDICESYLVL